MSFDVNENSIRVYKSARFFSSGKLSPETEEVLFVLHGYAQHAGYFLKKFMPFSSSKRLLVAPEGLSKFYAQGSSGKVVASWMTSENRLDEINDYIHYLNEVYTNLNIPSKIKVNVLGFSQGAATAARWVDAGAISPTMVVFYAGVFPPDMPIQFNPLWQSIQLKIVLGNMDPYYEPNGFEKSFKLLHERNKNLEFVKFEGKHEINNEVLRTLFNK